MNLNERLKNLWKLSENRSFEIMGGSLGNPQIVWPEHLAKKQKAMQQPNKSEKIIKVFLPRLTITPAEEIVNEPPQ